MHNIFLLAPNFCGFTFRAIQAILALRSLQLDISHQEMDRIVGELEAIYGSQPTAWLPVESIGMMLTHELGYEDLEEFEDAIKTTFPEFLAALPHIEVAPKEQDPNILVRNEHTTIPNGKVDGASEWSSYIRGFSF